MTLATIIGLYPTVVDLKFNIPLIDIGIVSFYICKKKDKAT
jgi:hypothetical protein